MTIVIRRRMERTIIVRFHTNQDNFDSDYERSKFFRSLHGWKQTVPKENKRYLYHRNGLLDEVPHVKIADSVFAVAAEHMRRVEQFFDQWDEKVEYDIIEAMMEFRKLANSLNTRNGDK
ncbi:MAG: hypothetical protein HYT72_00895 [Candidatus Aenigmarchaeota archaeon]|nr:hypothetical protein [Candidatus Aenigmarchaeota archaeon]